MRHFFEGDLMDKRIQAEIVGLIDSGNTDAFYGWSIWKRVRAQVLKLDKYECQKCKSMGRYTRADVVHHVKHLTDRPDLALSIWDGNDRQLVSLCRECHRLEHPELNRADGWRPGEEEITEERWD